MVAFENIHGGLVNSEGCYLFHAALKPVYGGSDVDGGSDARARDYSRPDHVPTYLTLSS